MPTPTLLFIGLDSALRDELKDLVSGIHVIDLPNHPELSSKLGPELNLSAILIRNPDLNEDLNMDHFEQIVRDKFPEVPMFAYFQNKTGFKKKLMQDHSFSELYLIPADLDYLKSELLKIISVSSLGSLSHLYPVNILDIRSGDPLPFETHVYLPMNRKYVRMTKTGESYSPEKLEKVKNHHFNTIYLPYEQLGLFFSYMAEILKNSAQLGLGITEKQIRQSKMTRSLLIDIIEDVGSSEESGKRIFRKALETVKSFIKNGEKTDWTKRFGEWRGSLENHYNHAVNSSVLAAFFSIETGIGNPEELALAGLFHDIGILELPKEIQVKKTEQMSASEFEQYRMHPELSLQLIQSKKIPLSEPVLKIIEQHHELLQGKGFPHQLSDEQILKESHILAIIDELDHLGRMNMVESMNHLRKIQGTSPSSLKYHPEVFEKIERILSAMITKSE